MVIRNLTFLDLICVLSVYMSPRFRRAPGHVFAGGMFSHFLEADRVAARIWVDAADARGDSRACLQVDYARVLLSGHGR